MAEYNNRPPFLFRLFDETEAENETFFSIKKPDAMSMYSGMTPLLSYGKMTFGAEGGIENPSGKLDTKKIKHENKL